VNPSLYRDHESHNFIYTNTKDLHCYNLYCPGFIVTRPDIPIGQILTPYTVVGGRYTYESTLFILKLDSKFAFDGANVFPCLSRQFFLPYFSSWIPGGTIPYPFLCFLPSPFFHRSFASASQPLKSTNEAQIPKTIRTSRLACRRRIFPVGTFLSHAAPQLD
ncbi:hypothetical protein LINGRAHAP2_LOCUS8112, partial [Linum grandiflorum]